MLHCLYPLKQVLSVLLPVLLGLGTWIPACALVSFLSQSPGGPHPHKDSFGPHLRRGAPSCQCHGPLTHHTHCPEPSEGSQRAPVTVSSLQAYTKQGWVLPSLLDASHPFPFQQTTKGEHIRPSKGPQTQAESPGTAEALY